MTSSNSRPAAAVADAYASEACAASEDAAALASPPTERAAEAALLTASEGLSSPEQPVSATRAVTVSYTHL
ncbi:hypothetical protein, partial [Streptomyces resistomycificus]|uniref:hypothetical protein n=1 Tax=Streptomyces resistomycificus TaxID=67356 RepID=UPI001CEC6B80